MAKSQVFTDIHTLDQEGVKKFAKFTIECGRNMMILGPAGTGKTEISFQAAEELGYEYVYLNLSVLEAPDLLGLPMIDEKTQTSKYALPDSFPRPPQNPGKSHKGKILIVDEIDKAKPELQNPMLELFQFRSINGTPLDFHAVIATGNRPDEGAFSMPISKALTNRCKVFQVDPQFDPWREWAVNVGLNGLVVGFLTRNREYFFKPNNSGDVTAYCSCSSRSWAYAANDVDDAHEKKITDYTFLQTLVAGHVGVEAATKFQVWLEHYRDIYPIVDRLVKSGKEPDFNAKTTMDRVIVTAIACGQEIAKRSKEKKPSDKEIKEVQKVIKNVCSWMKGLNPDIQIASVKSTLSMEMIAAYKMTSVPEFMEVFRSISKVMK